MKTQSIIKTALITASFSAMALISNAEAQVVNVDVNDASNPVAGTYSGVGAAADTGTFWNGFNVPSQAASDPTYTISNLTASDGITTTGISVSINSPILVNAQDLSGNPSAFAPALLNDFAYAYTGGGPDQPLNFTISGLTTGDTYKLYLYAQNAAYGSGGGSFTIGSTTLNAANTAADQTGFINGNNYVEFTGVVDGAGTLIGTVTNAGALSNNSNYLNGLQIVESAPVVPEPSTYALMGLGALALLVISRRRKA